MLVRRAVPMAVAGLIVAGLAIFWLRSRSPRPEAMRWRTRVVASFPIGERRDAVASYPGVDGQTYGPLAFAANGSQLCILDTYRSRVLIVARGLRPRQPLRTVTIPDGLLEAVAWDARTSSWLVADNRHLIVWAIQGGRARPLIQLGERKGLSGAIESLAVGPGGQIFIGSAVVGHGQLQATLGQYGSNGRSIHQHTVVVNAADLAAGTAHNPVVLLALSGISVGADGDLYMVSGSGGSAMSPGGVLAVNPATLQVERRVTLSRSRGHLALLGLTRTGTMYFTAGGRSKPRWVLGYDQEGKLVLRIPLPSESLSSGVYADVTPSGSLFLAETTPTTYRIRAVSRR
jgi:hypothetical protein